MTFSPAHLAHLVSWIATGLGLGLWAWSFFREANAIRKLRFLDCGVVLIFSWLMVFVVGCQNAVSTITPRALVFLALSGAATGLSWLCYFKALSIGNLSKVVAVDKSSTFLTILLALIFFREPFHWLTGLGIAVMIAGTALMLEKGDAKKGERGWLFYAAGSAVFAALQSILGKVGVQDMDSTLATALRTVVVLVFAWAIVLGKKEGGDWKKMTRRDALLLVLSGITTGASWLCYYRALQTGRASVVVPIDKCSMLFAVALSAIFLKEKQTRRSLLALALVVAGTFMIALA